MDVAKKKNEPARKIAAKNAWIPQNRHVRTEKVVHVVNQRKKDKVPAKTAEAMVKYFPIVHHVSITSLG